MERVDRELIEQSMKENFELRKLYEPHQRYEQRLDQLSRQPYLTSEEEVEQRKLKRLKLRGVERMIKLSADGIAQAA